MWILGRFFVAPNIDRQTNLVAQATRHFERRVTLPR